MTVETKDARLERLERERDELREVVEFCLQKGWEYGSVDAADLQGMMKTKGLLVLVPANEDEKGEWGVERVFVPSWSDRAKEAGEDR